MKQEQQHYRDRAARQIALAQATGAKAHASPDNRTVFVERADGTKEEVKIPPPGRADA
ncbi:MAG: hypothetical protein AB7J28_11675 [Hyphomonadaceae bacterium]